MNVLGVAEMYACVFMIKKNNRPCVTVNFGRAALSFALWQAYIYTNCSENGAVTCLKSHGSSLLLEGFLGAETSGVISAYLQLEILHTFSEKSANPLIYAMH